MNSRNVACVLQIALCAAAAFAVSTLRAEYNEIGTDIPMTGSTDFIAASGVTNVYTGLISGTGPAVVKGGGTVAFAHANNTYTGGTRIENAVFRLDADGCAGSGAITGAVNTAHVFMNCANVPNDMVFLGAYTVKTQLDPSAYPSAGQCFLLPLQSAVTVSGRVMLNGSSYLFNETSPAIVSSPTVTYENGISNSGYIFTVPKGRMVFAGRYVSTYNSRSRLGSISGAKGTMEFRASSNELYRADMYNANLDFKAVDAFPSTLFHYEYGENNSCKTYLNGNDQMILGFSWGIDASRPQPTETGTGQCWSSSGNPATVRITGCAPSRTSGTLVNQLALFGKITLVMDVNPTYTGQGFYQDFSVRKSTTTGDLIISNGDFRVSSTASFPNVPNIYVGVGGSFTNASTKVSAFAGCTNLTVLGTMACTGDATPFSYGTMSLTLGSEAEFSLPAGATATVKSLTVGGVAMPDDTYGDGGTPLAQIKQGTVVVRSGNLYVDCVSGNDDNDGTAGHPFKTIKAATTASLGGDVIHVLPGTYGEAEGSEKHNVSATSLCRVIIPANVTVESTGGAANTFIVGASAAAGDANAYGNGPGAIRCVYANNGAVLRGFTLTGGHTGITDGNNDYYGSAFVSAGTRTATIEDCIVSNNWSHKGSLYNAKVRRCRIIGNVGNTGSGNDPAYPAGLDCSYVGCIIDKNKGTSTIGKALIVESCTIGSNSLSDGTSNAQVLYWYNGKHRVVNTVFTRSDDRFQGTVYATNCVFRRDVNTTTLLAANCSNCLFNTDAQLASYKPKSGSVVIDRGDNSLAAFDLANEKDIFGTPRVLNVKLDIGAVEYDWRPTFAQALGRKFTMTYASPSVTTNATGGLVVSDGEVVGTVGLEGDYELALALTGGILVVYVGDAVAASVASSGEQKVHFPVPDTTTEVRIVFTPDVENPGSVVLRSLVNRRGFVLIYK